jgi:RNA polymerase sigma factor (TIGR02999 family)
MDTLELLRRVSDGDAEAEADLYRACYEDLRARAALLMRSQRASTLQPTALVHEAWLKLDLPDTSFENRRHFLRAATCAMRSVLVDHARAKLSAKRGSGAVREELLEDPVDRNEPSWRFLALDEGLKRLESEHPLPFQVAHLRIFGGLSHAEIAAVLDLTERSIERHWATAREHLKDAL